MTPATVAGMAKLSGAQVAALTDHNTSRNCPAFFRACEEYGVSPLAGMELTTAEDIHLVCLFLTCEEAAAFEEALQAFRVHIPNRPEIFGRQLVMDEHDTLLSQEEYLLTNATALSLEAAFEMVCAFGGVCYPAHVDRESNGIVAVLGTFPDTPAFAHAEFHDPSRIGDYCKAYPALKNVLHLYGSDSHRPEDVPDCTFALETEEDSSLAQAVFRRLKGARV